MTVDIATSRTETGERDLEWIRSALQTAIELEHSTIPLYTAAMLSLQVHNYTTYDSLRSVVMEEMVHMAIAANMLAAIGGSPRIGDLDPGFPRRGLPGGVEPDLHVGLAQLSPEQIASFMRLESPLFLLPEEFAHESYPTIGRLYQGIKDALVANADAVREAVGRPPVANQVPDNIGFETFVVDPTRDTVEQLVAGIDEILEQGEGSSSDTIATGGAYQGEESHYGRFAELRYGRRYQLPSPRIPLNPLTESAFFRGEPIAWPAVTNTLAVPRDGYDRLLELDPHGAQVRERLEAFDAEYSTMMTCLHRMWNGPYELMWPAFGAAIEHMMQLRVVGCFTLMVLEVPPDLVARLGEIYPDEHAWLAGHTRLDAPVFYGPRFRNTNARR